MQLRNARLCLDCDEIHEEPHCPLCASESFAFIKRWVPASERRARQRQPAEAEIDGERRETVTTYKELLASSQEPRLSGMAARARRRREPGAAGRRGLDVAAQRAGDGAWGRLTERRLRQPLTTLRVVNGSPI